MTSDLAAALLEDGVELWNLYGPTETTIWSTRQRIEAVQGRVPIGRPIENTRVYLLDSNLQPVPTGALGELYIGGAGLAEGYWQRPELTARKPASGYSGPGTWHAIDRTTRSSSRVGRINRSSCAVSASSRARSR